MQSGKYTNGLPDSLPAWYRPQPFGYESTGVETRFTNSLDPEYRSRSVFSFHQPDTLAKWLEYSDNFPDPNIIALEIVEDLEAALAQFKEITDDLGAV